ncbi:MAG: peptigoglycan-binding protein LysM [Candidatus Nephthysia bennettiae]|uniref:Peptigoglycan-binding protein LysM n=1 Tax=Candidatus Nephthysia bennettiae TaxID=3127016 RepID=A0A934KCY2_9BACT|nr:peptigoglycan-binding protein LysM [Candidatus Dormibacteraeota bacterium]MBJ7612133.1 peptigoglycan-binding protein LysM [Candidatus Dormibacteraeota bacterium]PZS00324.1 MAG: peptigoglycan-binding protein LysM [Candidatus Dormibacteraeota bacterium]
MALEYASLTSLDTGDRIEVLFNPNEYTLNKDNNFAQAVVPGLSTPLLQFVSGNLRTLEMELVFDSLEQHTHSSRTLNAARSDVRKLTQQVVDLMAVNPATHAPPVLLFAWGGLTFTGVLSKVNQRFTMFLEDGTPIRARLQVTLQEWKTALQESKEVKRQTADYTRLYRVAQGQTLSQVAALFYGDPALWRPIAIANQIEDPRRLPVALQVSIPKLPYRDPDTGALYRLGSA